ncbi:MAG: helix-turn-helix domain-containing protein [Planctomycetales bacterium]|nr:helix-turn-helix domain-containing protein [Planctomycetales bacterium]
MTPRDDRKQDANKTVDSIRNATRKMDSPMLSVKQTSELLSVSVATVYSLVHRGKLPSHRIGVGRGVIRIRLVDIEAYLESCKTDVLQHRKPSVFATPRRTLKHIRL